MSCAADAVVLISKAIDVDLEGQPVQFIRTKFLADRVELVMLQN
jgi:GntR family phosphonate transport system transcriptional regulator